MTRDRPPAGQQVGRRPSPPQRIGTPDNPSCGDRVDTLRLMSTALELTARTETISDSEHFRVDFSAMNVSSVGVSGTVHTNAWLIRDDVVVAVKSGPANFSRSIRSDPLEPGGSWPGFVVTAFAFCDHHDPRTGLDLLIRYQLGPASGVLQLPFPDHLSRRPDHLT